MRRHDELCDELGHDALCPEGPLVPRASMGVWPKGVSGNAFGPRRLRAARALIAEITDNGRTIIERLAILGGLMRDPQNLMHTDAVQVRALGMLKDLFWGKQIRGQVHHTGAVAHVPVTAETATKLAALSPETLDAIERAHLALAAEQAIDAEFTPAPGPSDPGDDQS